MPQASSKYYRAYIYSDNPSETPGVKEIKEDIALYGKHKGSAQLAQLTLVAPVASVLAMTLQVYRYSKHRPGSENEKHRKSKDNIEEGER